MNIGQLWNFAKYRWGPKGCTLYSDPIELSIQVTNRCTLACDMCQNHSRKIPRSLYHYEGGKDIEFQTFKQFVDRFRNAFSVSLIGTGEPFLNGDFFEMAAYAAFKRGMYVGTVSNGTVLRDKVDDILRCGLRSIEISLNGHNAEEFNRMTGQPKDCYSLICDNVRTLLSKRNLSKSDLRISLSFILDQQNYRNLFAMISLAEELGVDAVSFPNFLPSPVPGFTAEERCLYADNEDVMRILSKVKSNAHRVSIFLPTLLDRSRKKRYCRSYFRLLRVDGEGNVGGCACQLLNLAGNGKFYDEGVWNNDHFKSRRRIFLDQDLAELPPCQTCPRNNKPESGGIW